MAGSSVPRVFRQAGWQAGSCAGVRALRCMPGREQPPPDLRPHEAEHVPLPAARRQPEQGLVRTSPLSTPQLTLSIMHSCHSWQQ